MDKKAIFEIFFKCNSDDEHKFNDFSQMTHAGKSISSKTFSINHSIITKYFSFAKKCGNIPLLSYPVVRRKLMLGY